jgi:transcriptional regulator with XRE-family HTH domain
MKAWLLPPLRRRVGVAIREERTALGLSQAVLATHLHRDVDFIGKIERGEQNITIDTLERTIGALTAAYLKVLGSSPSSPPAEPPGRLLLKAFAERFGISLPPLKPPSGVGPAHRGGRYEAHEKAHDNPYIAVNHSQRQIMRACRESCQSAPELMTALGHSTRTGHFKRAVTSLLAVGLLELTQPDSPRSKHQRYRLTPKGKAWLSAHDLGNG